MDDHLIVGAWTGHYLVDPWTGTAAVINRFPDVRGWGLTWGNDLLFLMTWAGKVSELQVVDRDFKFIGRIPFPKEYMPVAPHQITWHDGRIWIADTQYDRFIIIDGEDFGVWRPLPAEIYGPDGKGNDKYHVNGCYHKDTITAVVCHNRNNPSQVRFHRVFDTPAYDIKVVGAQIHNCWSEGSHFYTCSSGTGDILNVNGSRVVHTGGFPRGVAITPEWNYIGISEHHFSCKEREKLDGKIYIYDKKWRRKHTCLLRGIGQMYELRVINKPDAAHYPTSHEMKFSLGKLRIRAGESASVINLREARS